MPFQTFVRPAVNPAGRTSQPTIGVDRKGFITISKAAHAMIGDPAAVIIEWDPDQYLIRLTAASPDDPNAFRTGGKNPSKRFMATRFLDYAGLGIPAQGMTFTARKQGTRALVADLSDMPARRAS